MDQQAASQLQLQMEALASQVQALTTAQQSQMQVNAQLQQEKEALEQHSNGVTTLLQASLTGAGQGQHPQQSAGSSAAGRPVSYIDVLKSVKQPHSLKDRDQWERFSFQVETYPAFLGEEFLDELDAARKNTTSVDPAGMTDDCRSRGRQLFAMLNSWTQELTVATKIARGIREQNGWEFWRLLWRELAPDNHSKNLVWRRALLSPKFPTKEANFQVRCQGGKLISTSMRPNMAKSKPSATKTSAL